MLFHLECPLCGEVWESTGRDDPDTNGCEVDDTECPICGWDDPKVTFSSYDDIDLEPGY